MDFKFLGKVKQTKNLFNSSLNLIRKAENFNADYIVGGSFFKSKLKPKAKKAKIVDLKKIRDKTKLPIVAIGGVNQKNYKSSSSKS